MPLAEELLASILRTAENLNPGDNLSPRVLRAIAHHASLRTIRASVETGCGGSTLLLSHLSLDHTAFAIEGDGGIITRLRHSKLLKHETAKFVEGPTQRMLPNHRFDQPLDLALLDGPHAFPFPQMEYYFVYPHLAANALLIIDDIHIPSIYDMVRFLRADAMFEEMERVECTVFFRRTAAPALDPFGDGWQAQRYNARPLLRFAWRDRLAKGWRSKLRSTGLPQKVWIETPRAGGDVHTLVEVSGRADLPRDTFLWLLVKRADLQGWWPQGGGAVSVAGGNWRQPCRLGEDRDLGYEFEIAAAIVSEETNAYFLNWFDEAQGSGHCAPVRLPRSAYSRHAIVRVRRSE